MEFILNGDKYEFTRHDVEARMRGTQPDQIFEHAVEVNGELYPPKQVFAACTGRDNSEFTTHRAQDVLRRLGFTDPRRERHQGFQVVTASAPPGGEPVWVLELRTPAGGRQEFQLADVEQAKELEPVLAYNVGTQTSTQVRAVHLDALGGEAVFTIAWHNVSAASLHQRPA